MILQLLDVMSMFTSSSERFQISHFILKLFDFIDSAIIRKVVNYLLQTTNLNIIL